MQNPFHAELEELFRKIIVPVYYICKNSNLASVAVLRALGFRPTDEIYDEPNNTWPERKYRLEISA